MTATYTKERELPAVRFTFELVNESAPSTNGTASKAGESPLPVGGGRAEKAEKA